MQRGATIMAKSIVSILRRILIVLAALAAVLFIAAGGYLYFRFLSPLDENRTAVTPLLFFNGTIITMDEKNPRAEAVLVNGETITHVGSLADAEALSPKGTRKIDLRGKTLIPGFNDNHTHSMAAGSFYSELMLWGKSCKEIAREVKKEADTRSPGKTIYGNLWDYTACPAPHRKILDEAAPNNPVFLIQYSAHAAWANSAQLAKMKIDRNTPDPMGGSIGRDSSGEPNGILNDTAMGSVVDDKYISILLDEGMHRKFLNKILGLYAAAGITSVQDNTWEIFTARMLGRYLADGNLTARFTCGSQYGGYLEFLFNMLTSFTPGSLWIREGIIKVFADGAFSTRTAWLFEPYAGDPSNTGRPRYEPAELERIVMDAAKRKKRLQIHAIGDRAVHEALNAIEKAQGLYPWTKDLRMRLEHVQLIKAEDVVRMKNLGVLAAVQPFALAYPEKDRALLGEKRAAAAYPYLTLLKAGVPVSFGSDTPAEVEFQPLLGIHYAVNRTNKTGSVGPLNPSERFTPEQALYAYTMGSAYAEFMEDRKGSITKGRLADLVVLSANPLAVQHGKIKEIEVLCTIVGGKVVYERK